MKSLFVSLFVLFSWANADAAVIFYLHGKIVEDKGDNAVHPHYGTYEYGNIVAALENEGHTVLSEIRPSGTDRIAYARTVVASIHSLLKQGVDPQELVVIGFSKGAQIAILVSQQLANNDVRFVIQAVCGSWLAQYEHLQLYGHILSQYETSDSAGSCNDLFERSKIKACELSISTGLQHGAFYHPIDEWFRPQQEWIADGTCPQSL